MNVCVEVEQYVHEVSGFSAGLRFFHNAGQLITFINRQVTAREIMFDMEAQYIRGGGLLFIGVQ